MSLLWDLVALKILLGDRDKYKDEKSNLNKRSTNNNVDKSILKIIYTISFGITMLVSVFIILYILSTVYLKTSNYLGGTETNLILIYLILSQYIGKRLLHLPPSKLTNYSVVGFFIFSSIYIIIVNFSTIESIILIVVLGLLFLFVNRLFSLIGLKIE